MRRLKKHQTSINKILRLDPSQITGNRRLLAEMLAIWLDSEGEEKQFIQNIIASTFGSAQRTRWNDPEDPSQKPADQSNTTKETTNDLKDVLALLKTQGGAGAAIQDRESRS